jgi:hypothetical protein
MTPVTAHQLCSLGTALLLPSPGWFELTTEEGDVSMQWMIKGPPVH